MNCMVCVRIAKMVVFLATCLDRFDFGGRGAWFVENFVSAVRASYASAHDFGGYFLVAFEAGDVHSSATSTGCCGCSSSMVIASRVFSWLMSCCSRLYARAVNFVSHLVQFQIPLATRLTEVFLQYGHVCGLLYSASTCASLCFGVLP